MSEIERDHVLRRAVQTLQQLPSTDADAIRRVVEAAAAQRVMPAADEPVDVSAVGPSRRRPWRLAGFAGLVAAAAIVGFFVRGQFARSAPSVAVASNGSGPAPMVAAVNGESDVRPIPQQFVFRSATARRVSVVGDFNEWNAARARMTREAAGDLWSVTIPIAPGRHTYGFMINDSTFTLDQDARVSRARDPDLGVEGSVVIVGRP
jgi:hypothetical protein